jgi:hypothetical protein
MEVDDIQWIVAIDHSSLLYGSSTLLYVLDQSLFKDCCIIEKDITLKQSLRTKLVSKTMLL